MVPCWMASSSVACCTLAVTVCPLVLRLRIFTSRPFGAAVVGALAKTSPTASEFATILAVDIVIVEPFGETARLCIPIASSTLVVFGTMVA